MIMPKRHDLEKSRRALRNLQAYFWMREWQAGEREADEDIRQGRVRGFKRVKDLMVEVLLI